MQMRRLSESAFYIDCQPIGVLPSIDRSTNQLVHEVCQALRQAQSHPDFAWLLECVPAYASVTVHYDLVRVPLPEQGTRSQWAMAAVAQFLAKHEMATLEEQAQPRVVSIPVCYNMDEDDDFEELLQATGLTKEQFIDLHTKPTYYVYMIGFAPGFGFLGGLDSRLHQPRRATPRLHIPAGTVAIGGAQTAVYPCSTPGGWNLIGRTPLHVFDVSREAAEASLLRAGDEVRFYSITREQFEKGDWR